MKIFSLILSVLLVLYTSPALTVRAQVVNPAIPIQQSPSHADAATQYSAQEGLGTAAQTLTLTPNGGEYVYIYEIDITNVVGASAVTAATTTTLTTTNLAGSPLWVLPSGVTAGTATQVITQAFPTGLRSQAQGTAVTFVVPQVKVNQGIHLNVAWRSAP